MACKNTSLRFEESQNTRVAMIPIASVVVQAQVHTPSAWLLKLFILISKMGLKSMTRSQEIIFLASPLVISVIIWVVKTNWLICAACLACLPMTEVINGLYPSILSGHGSR